MASALFLLSPTKTWSFVLVQSSCGSADTFLHISLANLNLGVLFSLFLEHGYGVSASHFATHTSISSFHGCICLNQCSALALAVAFHAKYKSLQTHIAIFCLQRPWLKEEFSSRATTADCHLRFISNIGLRKLKIKLLGLNKRMSVFSNLLRYC